MFAGFAAQLRCLFHPRMTADVCQCLRPVTAPELFEWLASLGNVLHVEAPPRPGALESSGVLLSDPALTPLLQVRWLMSASMIGADGPRECCQCLDRHGRVLGRFHLLPDTDYLSWDQLAGMGDCMELPSTLAVQDDFRPLRATVCAFNLQRLAGLNVVQRLAPQVPRSALSQRIATQLARSESMRLS